MKITNLACILVTSKVAAFPELNKNGSGKPCSILAGSKTEQTYERMGQGYRQNPSRALNSRSGEGGIPEGGFKAVEDDLIKLMGGSMDDLEGVFNEEQAAMMSAAMKSWPPDNFGNGQISYAGLMMRLAWHCSGSYRNTDGRGGCDGGRIRFSPEAYWEDNANLDKARMLLEPMKLKYGPDLSWADLIVLAGNAGIKSTGGPVLGFCGGRIDDADGAESIILGPSPQQEALVPCQTVDIEGNIVPSSLVGLEQVVPGKRNAGLAWNPGLSLTSMQGQCQNVQGTPMGPTTVELIYVNPGGPVTAPNDPVASGHDVRTAFSRMGLNDQETAILIGGGHAIGKVHGACAKEETDGKGKCNDGQTFTSGFEGAWTTTPTTWSNKYFRNLVNLEYNLTTTPAGEKLWKPINGPDVIMLTPDMSLAKDKDFRQYVEMYAADMELHDSDFEKAWYALTSRDMGPATRCIGDMVAEPQPFQHTLPPSPDTLPDYSVAAQAIEGLFESNPDEVSAFIKLALNCASTFRATDYRGGCNGARIRFPPESEWENNANLAGQVESLEGVKPEDTSTADMIVLAGIMALERTIPDLELPFCGGYVDAVETISFQELAPRTYRTALLTVTDDWAVKGLSQEHGVALLSAMKVGSQYYKDLLSGDSTSVKEMELLEDKDIKAIVETFASDEAALLQAFESGWTYMMTADRFSNNRDNACDGVNVAYKAGDATTPEVKEDGSAPAPEQGGPAPAPETEDSGAYYAVGFMGTLSVVLTTFSFAEL